jgi:hypothetical protein
MECAHAVFRNWANHDIRNPSPSVSSLENRTKLIESGATQLRRELQLKDGEVFLEKDDLFQLCSKIVTVRDMMECSTMIIYWVVHSVCDESIRTFLSEMRRDYILDDDNDNVGFLIQELITRFITPVHLNIISDEYYKTSDQMKPLHHFGTICCVAGA